MGKIALIIFAFIVIVCVIQSIIERNKKYDMYSFDGSCPVCKNDTGIDTGCGSRYENGPVAYELITCTCGKCGAKFYARYQDE